MEFPPMQSLYNVMMLSMYAMGPKIFFGQNITILMQHNACYGFNIETVAILNFFKM